MEYVSSYFTNNTNTDIETESITAYQPDTDKPPSVTAMSPDELKRILNPSALLIDKSVGEQGSTEEGRILLQNKVRNALVNLETRKIWKNTTFICLYGDRNPWHVPVSVRGLRKLLDEANDPRLRIEFKVINGANHFVSFISVFLSIVTLSIRI